MARTPRNRHLRRKKSSDRLGHKPKYRLENAAARARKFHPCRLARSRVRQPSGWKQAHPHLLQPRERKNALAIRCARCREGTDARNQSLLLRIGSRNELIAPWPERVAAFEPRTGRELWRCRGLNPLVYTSPLYADGIVVVMGGFNGSALAVKAGGSGDVTETHRLWQAPKTKQR